MIQRLSISNFALIENLEFVPSKGFTAITGETGAGKSIILGALGLLLGKRAEGTDLFDPTKKSVLEAVFKSRNKSVKQFCKHNDFDFEEELILRREILPSGKTRGFINDTPANISQLKELGEKLVNIHSQHAHIELKNKEFQFKVLDSFSGASNLVSNFRSGFIQLEQKKAELSKLKDQQVKAQLDKDYHQFLFNELDELSIKEGEIEAVETELNQLQHAEEIKQNISGAIQGLEEDGGAVISNLLKIESVLAQLTGKSKSAESLQERISQCRIELEDVYQELESIEDKAELNPFRLDELNTRINNINGLLHKHRLTTETELQQKQEELLDKLNAVTNLDEEILKLQEEIALEESELGIEAKEIGAKRRKAAPLINKKLQQLLVKLGIKQAQFQIQLNQSEVLGFNGFDTIEMLFSANAGKEPKEVAKVASGGELSRIMLSLMSIIASKTVLPTLIFDEIDTGVAGEVANKMGEIMKEMASEMQIISITHLPQVAAKGKLHYTVIKEQEAGKTRSTMRQVEGEERVFELAKMLSGEQVSSIAKENARILLNN